MVSFCLVISGGCLGGLMVLWYEFLCYDVGLGYGGVLLVGLLLLLMMLDWGWDGGDDVPCSGVYCLMRGWSWV